MRRKKNDKPEKAVRVQWLLFSAFTGFTILFIALLWIFQMVFLDNFYYAIMQGRMRKTADMLLESALQADFAQIAEETSQNEQICLSVFVIREGEETATRLADCDSSFGCVLHHLSGDRLQELYVNALENHGYYRLRLGDFFEQDGLKENRQNPGDRLITVGIDQASDGSYIMAVLDCGIIPVDSTVTTLRIQLGVISLFMLGISMAISFLLSARISHPIERINERAKGLSVAKYDADFNTGSYREVMELSETLTHAANDLSKVDRMQKELIANVSHDLRTPLTMIIGYGEVMRDIEGENTPQNIQVIIDEATRLSSLVNDLLEISRIQTGMGSIAVETFDLTALVCETVERYRRLTENNGYTFTFVADQKALVCADKGKMLQVICNLFNNAVNYSTDRKEITVSVCLTDSAVRVEIEDRGIGIPQEQLEDIWQRYYKVDKMHRRSVVGSGLGLSIVKEILDLHQARYGVKSRLGEGSTFWFELPLSEEKPS